MKHRVVRSQLVLVDEHPVVEEKKGLAIVVQLLKWSQRMMTVLVAGELYSVV
jgi:hypothetical protein